MKMPGLMTLALTGAVLAAAGQWPRRHDGGRQASAPAGPSEVLVGTVVGIADGDTLTILDGQKAQRRVRLLGIDAPESSQAWGQRAKQHLSGLVFQRQVEVWVRGVDRYGRTLGKVVLFGRDVNLEMVTEGLAWHYAQFAKEQFQGDADAYHRAEVAARAERRGLWADGEAVPPWEWRHQKQKVGAQ